LENYGRLEHMALAVAAQQTLINLLNTKRKKTWIAAKKYLETPTSIDSMSQVLLHHYS